MSLIFPQLLSGSMAQYPVRTAMHRRTILNDLQNGGVLKLDDPASSRQTWTLEYRGLTDAEREAIEELFRAAEGRLRTFTFLDPCCNLLAWSEALDKTVWVRGGLLQITSDGSQAGHATARLTNQSQIDQGIQQAVAAPGRFTYSFAVVARSATPCELRLSLEGDGRHIEQATQVADAWTLCSCSGSIEGAGQEIVCRMDVPAGATVHVQQVRLLAQPSPGEYKKTEERSGIYKFCRFDTDTLQFIAEGIDNHRVTIRLHAQTGINQ